MPQASSHWGLHFDWLIGPRERCALFILTMVHSMNPLNFKPSMNFEPPSDFTADSAGGKSSSWKKVFGIGCGVIFLMLAIAIGAGAFQVASCVGGVTSMAQNSQAVSQNAMQFALLLKKGEFKQAHKALAPSYAATMTLPQFEAMLEPHRALLTSSVPMLVNVEPQMNPGTQKDIDALSKIQKYSITIRFFSPQSPTALHMAVMASVMGEPEEGQPVQTQIEHIGTQLRPVDFRKEAPVVITQVFYDDLQLKGPQGVFAALSPSYQKNSTPEQFQTFVQKHPTLTKGLMPTVVFLDYAADTNPPGSAATVILKLNESTAYRFDLVRAFPSWRIAGIAPHELPTPTAPTDSVTPPKVEVEDDAKPTPTKEEK